MKYSTYYCDVTFIVVRSVSGSRQLVEIQHTCILSPQAEVENSYNTLTYFLNIWHKCCIRSLDSRWIITYQSRILRRIRSICILILAVPATDHSVIQSWLKHIKKNSPKNLLPWNSLWFSFYWLHFWPISQKLRHNFGMKNSRIFYCLRA